MPTIIRDQTNNTIIVGNLCSFTKAPIRANWQLTNATFQNGVLTYTGGTDSLTAIKELVIGETVNIGFKIALNNITSFTITADDGVGMDKFTENGASIIQDLTSAKISVSGDWLSENSAYLQDNTTYTAKVKRTAIDTVILGIYELNGTLIKEREAVLTGVNLNRVWISAGFTSPSNSFSTTLTIG